MRIIRKLAILKREETLESLKQLDDNVWTMVYKSSYGLDSLLKKGSKGIMDTVKHLQHEVKIHGLAINPDKDGFACSTFNAQNPDGDYLLGRNFDYKSAPCLVC